MTRTTQEDSRLENPGSLQKKKLNEVLLMSYSVYTCKSQKNFSNQVVSRLESKGKTNSYSKGELQ